MSREFDELLSAYLDGEVTPEERAAVERRLEQSPSLRETLDEFSDVGELVRSLPPARPPIDLPERVVAAISVKPLASTSLPRKKNRLFAAWPLAAAGTVLAAGVVIVVLMPVERNELADGLAVNAPMADEAIAPAGAPARGFSFAEGESRRTVLGSEAGSATWHFDGQAEATQSLTAYVQNREQPPVPGEVLSIVNNRAGQTQVVKYTVVDTRQIGSTMRTILANNSFNIVETETPVLPAGAVAAKSAGANRYVYYIEGPPQQIDQALTEIESLPVVQDFEDLGLLASDPEPAGVTLPAGDEARRALEIPQMQPKDKADEPASSNRSLSSDAAAVAASDLALPAAAPAVPSAVPGVELKRAQDAQLGDRFGISEAESVGKMLRPAPGQPGAVRDDAVPLPPASASQVSNNFLGVSAQLDSNSPMVENVLRTRASGNSLQGNAIQGNLLQRQPTGQSQNSYFRSRSLQFSEEQLGRKLSEASEPGQVGSQNESRGAVPRKQQATAGRAGVESSAVFDPVVVSNPQSGPTPEQGLMQVLLILEPQPPLPATAPAFTEPAQKKSAD